MQWFRIVCGMLLYVAWIGYAQKEVTVPDDLLTRADLPQDTNEYDNPIAQLERALAINVPPTENAAPESPENQSEEPQTKYPQANAQSDTLKETPESTTPTTEQAPSSDDTTLAPAEQVPQEQTIPEAETLQTLPTEQPSSEQIAPEQTLAEQLPAEPAAQPSTEKLASEQSSPEQSPEQPSLEESSEEYNAEEALAKLDQDVTIKGIDTISLAEPQGNWLFKRIWWEKAELEFETIRTLGDAIGEARMYFFKKRTEIEKKILDPFYISIGLSQGELKEVLAELLRQLDTEKQEAPPDTALVEKTVEQKNLKVLIQEEQKQLEGLEKRINEVTELDDDLDQVLSKIMELINDVRRYEREAWGYFKEISRVLSDNKARELYIRMKTIARNVKAIYEYMKNPLRQHFDMLEQKITEHIDMVKKDVDSLKEKGIDLKQQADKMRQQACQPPMPEGEKEEETPKPQSTWSWMKDGVGGFFSTIWNGIAAVISWPFGGNKTKQESYEEEESIPQSETSSSESETSVGVRSSYR